MSEPAPARETLSDSEAKVFLSYSRKDRERAQTIADVLRDRNFGVFKDTDDILPTEEWRTRLEELIQEADTIVFLLSPYSAASEVCAWEVEYATSLNKRIAPIVIDDVEGDAIPPLLARLNFIFCTPRDPFENAVATLISALNTDIDWIREHTRINGLARRWRDAGKPTRLLPRGQDIADMERWRDGHPNDAPAILPAQSGYITEARAAAGRRQRNWIAGTLATTAVTASLAVFAYFQSVEADAQRVAAVENAAEAERQRQVAHTNAEEAETQRKTALKQLAGDRLRGGNRVSGLRALFAADPDAPQIPTIAAGLHTPAEGYPSEWGETPLFWNDELRFLTAPSDDDGGQNLLPVAPFPAKYRDWVYLEGDRRLPFIVSATGAVRLLDNAGQIAGANESGVAFEPCMTAHEVGKATVYGTAALTGSACGLAMITMSVSKDGVIEQNVLRNCEDNKVTFPSLPGKFYEVQEVFDHCYGIIREGEDFTQWDDGSHINPVWYIPNDGYPSVRDEENIWRATGKFLPRDITAEMIADVRALGIGDLPKGEMIGVLNFEGAEAGGYHLPEIYRADGFTTLASITNWGGTGGEINAFCSAPTGAQQVCTLFHGFGGYEGIAVDAERGKIAIYGGRQSFYASTAAAAQSDQEGQPDEARLAHLWIIQQPGTRPQPVQGLEAYGRLLDADFRENGQLALLTDSAALLLDVETGAFEIIVAVEGAEAARWVADDVLMTYGSDRLTFIKPGKATESLPFVLRPADPDVERHNHSPWIAPTDAGDMVAIGRGPDVQIFDIALRAPLSAVIAVPDPQVGEATGTLRLSRLADGGVELHINTRTFVRAGKADGDIADFLDPEAPFRQ